MRTNRRIFYALYELCNRLGWGGALPPCKLSFNCSNKPSHVAGFAAPERPYPRLCLNLSIVAREEADLCVRRGLLFPPDPYILPEERELFLELATRGGGQ